MCRGPTIWATQPLWAKPVVPMTDTQRTYRVCVCSHLEAGHDGDGCRLCLDCRAFVCAGEQQRLELGEE